jgi:CheY-like chemotaxis protein
MDSGIGIDAAKTEQILLAFEQADLSTTRKYGGTGLGLTISNQLIQLMGGTKLNIVALQSGGSSFSFDIPFTMDESLENHDIEANDLSKKMSFDVKRALIVEDNVINQKVLFKLLEKIEINSDIANNGKEAVMLFDQNEYDIIFMDLHMPEMDGFEATAKIQESNKYKKGAIPIIAVTASAFDEDKVKAISKGMDDFITKPIILKNLEETIIKQINLKVLN